MKDFRSLKVGDKFVVVDKWNSRYGNQDAQGGMDYWLGKTLTIWGWHNSRVVTAHECDWSWFPDLVDWDKTAKINKKIENVE